MGPGEVLKRNVPSLLRFICTEKYSGPSTCTLNWDELNAVVSVSTGSLVVLS